MRADWTVSGAHISGSTAPPRVAMRRPSGGAATTSTANNEVIVTSQFRERRSRPMTFERTSQQAFFGTSALLFAASAALTTVWCGSMSAMGKMPMPGGWTMSMAWMPMPGQTWLGAFGSFVGMWVVVMILMMLPSLVPTLWLYPHAVGSRGATPLN